MGAEQTRIRQLRLNGGSVDANVVDPTNDHQQANVDIDC